MKVEFCNDSNILGKNDDFNELIFNDKMLKV